LRVAVLESLVDLIAVELHALRLIEQLLCSRE
jgi:hypothetical protein